MQLPTVGQRFISQREIGRAHEFDVPANEIGTVAEANAEVIIIKMDNPIVGCAAEWDNSIIYNIDDAPEGGSQPSEFQNDFKLLGE